MENAIYEEKMHDLTIKIYQDTDARSPSEDEDTGLFLVGYHRNFSVDAPRTFFKLPEGVKRDPADKDHVLFTKGELQNYFDVDIPAGDKAPIFTDYHVFGLEAYIHSGVCLALSREGAFPDRQWDVSQLGAVLVSKKEWRMRKSAKKAAEGLIRTWNDSLSGNVYGYVIEDDAGEQVESCWGFYGDYDAECGALLGARAVVDHLTKKGRTDKDGQLLWEKEILTPAISKAQAAV